MCGDFNCQYDGLNNDKSVSVLSKALKHFELFDCWDKEKKDNINSYVLQRVFFYAEHQMYNSQNKKQ